VQLLSEEVCLVSEKYLGALDLAQVESLRLSFIGRCHDRVAIASYAVSKVLRIINDLLENLLFFRLEWQIRYFVVPVDQCLKSWSRGIGGDLDPPVTDGTGVLVILFDFPTSDLQALAVVPVIMLRNRRQMQYRCDLPFMT